MIQPLITATIGRTTYADMRAMERLLRARTPAGVIAVAGLTVIDGRIAAIDLILDADKLAGLTSSG